jgi:hypothetical protein
MTFLAIFALVVLAAAVGMIVSVQRRGSGYYANPTGQDRPNQPTPEEEAGTHSVFHR